MHAAARYRGKLGDVPPPPHWKTEGTFPPRKIEGKSTPWIYKETSTLGKNREKLLNPENP